MAYTVLARKYRSRTFSEVIGQEPIATTLASAVRSGRIHHGYLFTGTRGVGKTSMARILAKALNCLKFDAPTAEPCCECDSCSAIAEGQDIDVVEIDAASNTGVDNIRELRGNTAYRPARARFKVYIIDEVHMLSTGAFNALLKTLEEPPDHVKFILATTELQKVPATIQSRCQRFVFRNIGPEEIAERLDAIINDEGSRAEPAVVRRIARLANGSMRDALSILDQLMSTSEKTLTAVALDEMLPPPQDEQLLALLSRAADGDAAHVLATTDAVLNAGRGIEVLCHDLIETLRTLMLVRVSGVDAPYADVPAAARDEYATLSQRFEPSQYVQMIAMLEELRRNVRFSGAGRALTDALMVRLANIGYWGGIEQLLESLPARDATEQPAGRGPAAPSGGDEKKKSPPALAARADVAATPTAPGPQPPPDDPAVGPIASRDAADIAYRPDAAAGSETDPRPEVSHRRPIAGVAATSPAATDPGDGRARAAAWATDAAAPDEYDPSGAVPPDEMAAEVATEEPARGRAAPAGALVGPSGVRYRAATPQERMRVENDPLMREIMDLFEGTMTSCDWREQAPAPEQESAE